MPRLKVTDVDIDALEEADYREGGGDYQNYEGDIPPVGLILYAFVKKMWLTYTAEKPDGSGGDPMLKVLTVADGNEDTKHAEFEGCPLWENYPLTAGAKFKWQPFLDQFGLKLRDILGEKSKLYVEDEDDNNGAPITKIASFVPGSDDAYCRIVTEREKYSGNWQARVGTWLPYEATGDEETVDDDPDEGPDDDPDETPDPPARGRRTASKAPATKAPATTRGSRARPAAAKATPAKGGRGRRGATGSSEEPPF